MEFFSILINPMGLHVYRKMNSENQTTPESNLQMIQPFLTIFEPCPLILSNKVRYQHLMPDTAPLPQLHVYMFCTLKKRFLFINE